MYPAVIKNATQLVAQNVMIVVEHVQYLAAQLIAKILLMVPAARFMQPEAAQVLFVVDAITTIMLAAPVHLPDQATTVPTTVFQKMTQDAVALFVLRVIDNALGAVVIRFAIALGLLGGRPKAVLLIQPAFPAERLVEAVRLRQDRALLLQTATRE